MSRIFVVIAENSPLHMKAGGHYYDTYEAAKAREEQLIDLGHDERKIAIVPLIPAQHD